MQISVANIWLFKTPITSPFILDPVDGLDIVMSSDQVIDTFTLPVASFLIDVNFLSGLDTENETGGSDFLPQSNFGKLRKFHQLGFNLPLFDQETLNKIIGKQWSWLIQLDDTTFKACFGNFRAQGLAEDNQTRQRLTLESESNHYLYTVSNPNVQSVLKTLTCVPLPGGEGFDYELDFELE